MIDIPGIARRWETDEPIYADLGRMVTSFIKAEIPNYEILPEVAYRTKDLLSIVKKIKKKQKVKEYSYDHINDKLGVRIICSFNSELPKIDEFVKRNFNIKQVEYKKDALDFDRLDYISNHYDLTINPKIKQFKNKGSLKDKVFELQVRTLNQHAWSNSAHSLSYKQDAELSSTLKRRVYRLLTLYEIADDEIEAVNSALINQPDNLVYTLLRKLESKIYKYARVDYDRETSIYSLKKLLGYFETQDLPSIGFETENFIAAHETKIKGIFEQNKSRYHEIPFLTQPEIFLVWYGLDRHYYSIKDNWSSDFDWYDLEQISSLWGKNI